MYSSRLVVALAALSVASAVTLASLKRRGAAQKGPPSATFEEWIASVVAYEEAEQGGTGPSAGPTAGEPRMSA